MFVKFCLVEEAILSLTFVTPCVATQKVVFLMVVFAGLQFAAEDEFAVDTTVWKDVQQSLFSNFKNFYGDLY